MGLLEKGLLALAVLLVLAAGVFAIDANGYNRAVAKMATQVVKVDAKREAVAAPIAEKHAKQVIKVVTVTETILKDRPIYVQASDCPMSPGFRVMHDAAANGEVPDAARIPDAAPAPATDVADTVASNYGTCHKIRADLVGLQEWVAAQQALKE